jgi:putative transposase
MSRNKFCKYMKFNRSTLYYRPKGESAGNLDIMEKMDKYYIKHPTAGVFTMVNMLLLQGISVNPKRIRRLMRKMNLQAIYPQKCLSKGGKPKFLHFYLLRGLNIDHPN